MTDKEKDDYKKLKKSVEDLSNAQFDLQLITLKRAELAAKTAEKEAEEAEKNIEKARQDYAKYLTELQNLRTKFLLTEEQQIAKRYDDELKKIKGNSELERQLREAIIKERQKALEDFTNQEVQKNLELQEKIKENELKLQTNKALEAAKTSDEILRIETALANNINALEIERIERVRNEQIRLAEGNAELIKKANQEADIAIQESEKRREQSIKDSNDKILAERKKQLEDETKIVIDETNKQLTEIQNKRQNILNESGGGFGILGTLDNLKSNFDEERRLVTEQVNKLKDLNQEIIDSENTSDAEKEAARQRNIQLEEDYQKTLTQINADESQLRQQIIQDEINNRTQQIGQALAVVETLSSVQLDNERSRLDQSRAIQDAEFERRREQIEESITDENKRAEALKQLDAEINASNIAFEKKAINLRKKEIKRERNFALAQIALSSAQGIATALTAADKTNPISFALSLAANIAAVVATIAKARNALKDANAAEAALGAGGGGGDTGSLPSISPGGGTPGTQNVSPGGFQPTGVNPTQFGRSGGAQPIPTQPQQFVSVVEIERVRNSVTAVETNNTITSG